MKEGVFILAFIFSLISWNSLSAQETLAASGGEASGDGGTASFTAGQLSYETNSGQGGVSTHGVQQAYEIFVLSGENRTNIKLQYKAYPNPATDFLYLELPDFKNEKFQLRILDQNARVYKQMMIDQSLVEIDMSELPASSYFLQIFTGNQMIKTFQIIKN